MLNAYMCVHGRRNGQDQGRVDDLWALFYVLVDLALGGSPWRPHTVRRYTAHCCPCARALFTYLSPHRGALR